MKPLLKLAFWPLVFVTVTLTASVENAGGMAVIWGALCTVAEVAAALPKVIVTPARRSVPMSVTAAPPFEEPSAGETALRVEE